jgi:DNA-binding CsgD family transcriptional regulator
MGAKYFRKCPECGGQMYRYGFVKMCWGCRKRTLKEATELRARKLLILVAEDKPLKEIAAEWRVSPKTMEYHWATAKRVFGFQTVVGAVLKAVQLGLVSYSRPTADEMGALPHKPGRNRRQLPQVAATSASSASISRVRGVNSK